MANARGKAIDNTHLSIDQAEARGFLHRDYIAHCFRWTHVVKYLMQKHRYKGSVIWDLGCGIDLPLAMMLYSSKMMPKEYVGFEYNSAKRLSQKNLNSLSATGRFPVRLFTDFTWPTDFYSTVRRDGSWGTELPNVIVSFEVIEHIEPRHAHAFLKAIYEIAADRDCDVFISTPAWDPGVGAAANHVSEIRYEALGALLETLGFTIVNHYGTFASQKDYKSKLNDAERAVFDRLSPYYDSNVLATFFAPMYPQYSRNVLWHLRASKQTSIDRLFPPLATVQEPWTSSEHWRDLAGI